MPTKFAHQNTFFIFDDFVQDKNISPENFSIKDTQKYTKIF